VKSPAQQKADSQDKIGGRPLDLDQPGSYIPLADTDKRRNKHQAAGQEETNILPQILHCPVNKLFSLSARYASYIYSPAGELHSNARTGIVNGNPADDNGFMDHRQA
jgi:hypothetical protein